jgi:hypothetical protein
MRDFDQPLAGQRLHRLADRRAADAEAFHQLALGRHFVAGLELAILDQLLEAGKHLVGQLCADDAFARQTHGPLEFFPV